MITGTLTAGSLESAEFTPSESVSELMVERLGGGYIELECYTGSVGPVKVLQIDSSGVIPISTSSTDLKYKLRASGKGPNFKYYLGP